MAQSEGGAPRKGGDGGPKEPPRVLVAGTGEAIELVRLVLGGDIAIVPAVSVEAAVQRIDSGIALVLANIGFDDSRIFDFLGALREGDYRGVPVLCFRMHQASLPPAMTKSVELALSETGIAALVDVPALAQERGMDGALRELRRRVLAMLYPEENGDRADRPGTNP